MDQNTLQFLLALAMLLTTAIAGFIPLKILKMLTKKGEMSKRSFTWLSMLSCFSGGVFMSTCFLDILPDISENYTHFLEISSFHSDFPFPHFFICIGFLLVYLIEEICIRVFSMSDGHSHGGVDVEKEAPANVDDTKKFSIPNDNLRRKTPFDVLENERMMEPVGTKYNQVVEESMKYATAPQSETTFLKSLTFAIAISFHSILEGFALGVQESTTGIVTLFVSLLLHKAIEAFSVGLQICRGNTDRMKAVIVTITVYALMTPIGSILGTLLQSSDIEEKHKVGMVLVLESMAAGTFIYVTFLEILAHEKSNAVSSLKQLLAIFIGFLLIACVQFGFSGHNHGHPHGLSTSNEDPLIDSHA